MQQIIFFFPHVVLSESGKEKIICCITDGLDIHRLFDMGDFHISIVVFPFFNYKECHKVI
jgi:hypothetical protein